MKTRLHGKTGRILTVGLLALTAGGFIGMAPAEPLQPAKPADKPAVVKDPLAHKVVKFEMRDKPWSAVLEWLADQTGLYLVAVNKPTGTFNFIAPRGGKTEFTIPEVIDILNEALLAQPPTQKYIIIRRTATLTVAPADEKVDPAIIPRITVDDLDSRGKTELVQIAMPLTTLVAEDFAPEVKKMMGPFGEVVPISTANQLVMIDTAGNLRRIYRMVKELEQSERGQAETFTHTCVYIKARDAEKTLKEILGDPREEIRAFQPQQPQFGGPGGFRVQMAQPGQPAAAPAAVPARKIRMHYIAADEATNTIIVTGPANKIAQAREVLKKIDVKDSRPPIITGPPRFETYTVSDGNAEAVAKALQSMYPATSSLRISSIGNSKILVYAPPEDQSEIMKYIKGGSGGTAELLTLQTLDPVRMAETLQKIFPKAEAGGPYIEADGVRNALIVKGTKEQVDEIKATLKSLGEGATDTGDTAVIQIEQGSATALAEALEKLLPQMRKNPVKVIIPDRERVPPPQPAPVPPPEKKKESRSDEKPRDDKSAGRMPRESLRDLVLARKDSDEPPAQPQKKDAKDDKASQEGEPVTIMVQGNRILVNSKDPKARALVQKLIRLYTEPQKGEGGFEYIKLKNASAVDTAKILEEFFNGNKPEPRQQQFPFFIGGRFGMQPQTPPPQPRIRVVADERNNALLVRANPLDMLTIRELLGKSIDVADKDSAAVIRPWTKGPLKHASAAEVANVIRDIYREHINNNPVPGATAGGFGRRFGRFGGQQNQNVDANGNPRGVDLSISVDDHTNTLIMACTEAMYKDISKLVDELDAAAGKSARTVRVVSIKGIDPTLVQEAIDAIQGRQSTFRSNTNGMGNQRGFQGGGMQGNGPPFRGGGGGGGGQQGGGRPFFANRVKDDPDLSDLYDPQHPEEHPGELADDNDFEEEQQPPIAPPTTPGTAQDVRGPRSNVRAEALPELGVIVISGENQADVEAVLQLIDYLQKLGAGAEFQVKLVPLEYGDPVTIANTLIQLYQRVQVTPTGNVSTGAQARPSTTIQTPGGAQITQTTQQTASVVLIPLGRFHAILLAAPKARIADVTAQIKQLDKPNSSEGRTVAIPLKNKPAARVAATLTSWYSTRYAGTPDAQNSVHITAEESTNTLLVQAGAADLEEIRSLAERIDTTVSPATNQLQIVPLHFAIADDMATLLLRAITEGAYTPSTPTTGPTVVPSPAGIPGLPFGAPGVPAVPRPATAAPTSPGAPTRSSTIRFIAPLGPGGAPLEVQSGLLEDIHIWSDPRTNSLVISAPPTTMPLILALLRTLDVVPTARAEVNIFTLKRADATAMAVMLQQLFLGTGGLGAGSAIRPVTPVTPTGTTGGPGAPGGFPGGTPGGFPGGAPGGIPGGIPGGTLPGGVPGATGTARPSILTIGGVTPEGAPIVELRITIDERTNSLIVAGSRSDLDVVEALVDRLDSANVQIRENRVYRLKNSTAPDIATALQNFLTSSLRVLSSGLQLTAFQEIERDVVVVAEPISNTLLISATPKYFPEIIRIVDELDALPPQVVIQVLVAEVDLTGTEEFGVEIGLQSPILFSRSIVPATGTGGTVQFTNATGGLVPPGVTVSGTTNPSALPGFNFVTDPVTGQTAVLGNNPLAGPGVVGFQGLNQLGVGRTSPTAGVGGFVFSAASNTFNLLIRALKTQGRIDILSRPQVMTLDNQSARVLVGQSVPYVNGVSISGLGTVTPLIQYRDIGVQLQVTPKISPDGNVLMRVIPEISSLASSTINLGNGVLATAFNVQTVETTVSARDGETVAIGGLIAKRDAKQENKIPWLGDLPYLGAMFRYRTQNKTKTELLVILTPHVVRSPAEADRVLAEEAHRMDWVLGDVVKMHGTTGLEPIVGPPPGGPGGGFGAGSCPPVAAPEIVPEMLPATPALVPGTTEPPAEQAPMPRLDSSRKAPQWVPAGQPATTAARLPVGPPAAGGPALIATDGPASAPAPAANPPTSNAREATPPDQGKDVGVWNGFHSKS